MITSHSNKGIKEVIQLMQKTKERKEKKLFVAEGVKMFLEAPADRILKVYAADSFAEQMPEACRRKLAGLSGRYESVADDVFRKMSDTKTPQGILCVVRQFSYELEDVLAAGTPLLVLLENLQDPGNLGTIFRAGEGAGVTGILMSGSSVDIYNPKTIRATMGSIYRMPFFCTERMTELIGRLQEERIAVYAAHLRGAAAYDACDYTRGTAFLIGNEGNGLREETAAAADASVLIPMAGRVESLNAAVAASILLFEAARQRRAQTAH
ncbi:MAG: RNA methyltransferase [Blautia sp.]|nr:RNA methyltransferase [Blautia sp.]MCM1202020.1 RNA methyltransferase [Bacteroides fragilis]